MSITSLTLCLATTLGALAQEPAPPPAAGQDASLPAVAPPGPPARFAMVGGTVHTLTEGEEPARRTVVVNLGRVEAVLPPDAPLEDGLEVLDVTGLHLVPGLIDGHVNHDVEHDTMYVARGVTLVRDVGSVVHDILQLRRPDMRQLGPGPDLYICGPSLSGNDEANAMTWGLPNPRAAREVLPEKLADLKGKAVEMGLEPEAFDFDYLYFRPDLQLETARALIEAAHDSLDLQVWGPIPAGADLGHVVAAGQDGLVSLQGLLPEGRSWTEVTLDDLGPALKLLAASEVAVTPLLATTSRQLGPPADLDGRLALLSPVYESSWRVYAESITASSEAARNVREGVLALQRATVHRLWTDGVTLVPGSGTPFELLFPGDALLDELDQWVAAGIPAGEVLRLATAGAADALGLGETRGRIAPGRVADIVALGTDPRTSLASFRDPELVVLRGRTLERWDLEDRATALAAAQQEAREEISRELEIQPPDMPPGELLLSGSSQTEAGGLRVAAERWAVVDLLDGRTAYGTRMVVPGAGPRPEYKVHLVQTFKGDRLESFQLSSESSAEDSAEQQVLDWTVEGTLLGGSNRMSLLRRHTLAVYANNTADQPVAFVDHSDALTALIMARHMRAGTREEPATVYPIKFEGNTWEPVQDRWITQVTEGTRATVGQSPYTQTVTISGVDADGKPVAFQRRVGAGRYELRLFEAEGSAPPQDGRVFDGGQ